MSQQPSKFRHLRQAALTAVIFLYLGVGTFGYASMTVEGLPSGYYAVSIPTFEPQSGDPALVERLLVAERNKVLHSVNLDRTSEHWADRLLCISVGFQDDWTPADFYALFPQGYKGREQEASAFLNTIMVQFGRRFESDSKSLRSVNRLGYTLSQEGEYLVIGRHDEERWYFESPDGGTKWRLAKIGWTKHPGRFTVPEYTNGQITSLRFPNGTTAKIGYDGAPGAGGLPNKIEVPWGETTLIERQAGLITQISIHRQLPNGALSKPLKTYSYAYGADRKISHFVNSFGIAFDLTYTQHDAVEHGLDCNIYEVVIRNMVDGSFEYHRHMNAAKEWEFQTRWGTAKDTPQTAPLTEMVRRKAENHRWDKVSEARGSETREVNYERDKKGGATAVVDAEGRTRLVDHDKLGRPTREVTPDGKTTQTVYNDLGQRTRVVDAKGRERVWEYDEAARPIRYMNAYGQLTIYEYDERGYCKQSVVDGQLWQYHFDDWGRLTWAKDPRGRISRWFFDSYGQLVAEARFKPDLKQNHQEGDALPAAEDARTPVTATDTDIVSELAKAVSWTKYEYDEQGRLIRTQRSNGEKDQYEYEPRPNGRLAAHIRPDGIRVTYAYDALRRLHEIRDPTKGLFQYWYHPSGALRITRTEEKSKAPVICRYNHMGELFSKTDVGKGETQFVYDKAGELVEEVKPSAAKTSP